MKQIFPRYLQIITVVNSYSVLNKSLPNDGELTSVIFYIATSVKIEVMCTKANVKNTLDGVIRSLRNNT